MAARYIVFIWQSIQPYLPKDTNMELSIIIIGIFGGHSHSHFCPKETALEFWRLDIVSKRPLWGGGGNFVTSSHTDRQIQYKMKTENTPAGTLRQLHPSGLGGLVQYWFYPQERPFQHQNYFITLLYKSRTEPI